MALSPTLFDCALCLRLLYNPATTQCGHTFCASCLTATTAFGSQCPLCRRPLERRDEWPINVLLQKVVETLFPEQYEERRRETELSEASMWRNLPFFLLDTVLYPGCSLFFHIFEPRYALMLSRCMATNKAFGVVNVRKVDGVLKHAEVGTVAHITELTPLMEGSRNIVRVMGGKRFRIVKRWERDAILYGDVEYFEDLPQSVALSAFNLPDGTRATQAAVENMFADALAQSQHLFSLAPPAVRERIGLPPTNDIVAFSFWLSHVLPINTETKQQLLGESSTLQRISIGRDILRRAVAQHSSRPMTDGPQQPPAPPSQQQPQSQQQPSLQQQQSQQHQSQQHQSQQQQQQQQQQQPASREKTNTPPEARGAQNPSQQQHLQQQQQQQQQQQRQPEGPPSSGETAVVLQADADSPPEPVSLPETKLADQNGRVSMPNDTEMLSMRQITLQLQREAQERARQQEAIERQQRQIQALTEQLRKFKENGGTTSHTISDEEIPKDSRT